ncbi:MAG: hypothetical protein PHW19_07590 [Salinivirgaceae bacterium]|nr:hypothetical protein [Salinivirgaceae bacterium]
MAISIKQLIERKRELLPFDGAWVDAFGKPESVGSWFIYGRSRNGKTSFTTQLATYMSTFKRVVYYGYEEGDSESIAQQFERAGAKDTSARQLKYEEKPGTMAELVVDLEKKHSAQTVFIDSIQEAGFNYRETKEQLLDRFPHKLFVFISQVEGSGTLSADATRFLHKAMVKIHVKGFGAFVQSRYGGGEPFPVWPERFEKFKHDE